MQLKKYANTSFLYLTMRLYYNKSKRFTKCTLRLYVSNNLKETIIGHTESKNGIKQRSNTKRFDIYTKTLVPLLYIYKHVQLKNMYFYVLYNNNNSPQRCIVVG